MSLFVPVAETVTLSPFPEASSWFIRSLLTIGRNYHLTRSFDSDMSIRDPSVNDTIHTLHVSIHGFARFPPFEVREFLLQGDFTYYVTHIRRNLRDAPILSLVRSSRDATYGWCVRHQPANATPFHLKYSIFWSKIDIPRFQEEENGEWKLEDNWLSFYEAYFYLPPDMVE
jgi:hypothetical protein